MKYTTQNVNIHGTSLRGYITTDYDTLVKYLGEPNTGDEYKIDAEWDIEFDDGRIATVYNYKDGRNYCGAVGLPVDAITNWHIGGNTDSAPVLVHSIINDFEV